VELGDLDGAHDDLVRAVALGPEIAELYQQLGEVCSRQGDVAGAVAAYDRVTELVPDSGWGWACRGDLLMAAQDFRAAEAIAQAALLLEGGTAADGRRGFLAGIQDFRVHRLPEAGETLEVEVRLAARFGPLVRFDGRVSSADGGEEIATGSVLVRQGRAVPGDEVGVP